MNPAGDIAMKSATLVLEKSKITAPQPQSFPSNCVLDLWEQGIERYAHCAAAVARLIVAEPALVSGFADPAAVESALRAALSQNLTGGKISSPAFWFSATAQFMVLTARPSDAVAIYRQGLDHLKTACGHNHAETHILADEMERLLRRLGREEEACAIGHELRVKPLMAQDDEGSLLALRGNAYDAFAAGRYAEAEAIYRHLLARNFEPAGTHCHLARVLLALGRDTDATEEVIRAWDAYSGDETYIVVRILYLKALLAALGGENVSGPLTAIEQNLLNQPETRRTWLIEPILERVQSRLTPKTYAQFARLSRIISGGAMD
jgi:hypothetical protein